MVWDGTTRRNSSFTPQGRDLDWRTPNACHSEDIEEHLHILAVLRIGFKTANSTVHTHTHTPVRTHAPTHPPTHTHTHTERERERERETERERGEGERDREKKNVQPFLFANIAYSALPVITPHVFVVEHLVHTRFHVSS
jgi:hypothetical protein